MACLYSLFLDSRARWRTESCPAIYCVPFGCGLLLVQEFVVENGRRESYVLFGVSSVFRADNPALAEYAAVLLPGNFFGHLEHHLDQCVGWKRLRPPEQHA